MPRRAAPPPFLNKFTQTTRGDDPAIVVLQKHFLQSTSRLDMIMLLSKCIIQQILNARRLSIMGSKQACAQRLLKDNRGRFPFEFDSASPICRPTATPSCTVEDAQPQDVCRAPDATRPDVESSVELDDQDDADEKDDPGQVIESPKTNNNAADAPIPGSTSTKRLPSLLDSMPSNAYVATLPGSIHVPHHQRQLETKSQEDSSGYVLSLMGSMNHMILDMQRQLASLRTSDQPVHTAESRRPTLTADMLAKLPPLCVKLFEAKRRTNLSFVEIGGQMQRSDVWVAAVFFGQAKPSFEDIKRMRNIFGAQGEMSLHDITEREVDKYFPERGLLADFLPADPTLTRLNEVLKVYGHPIKAIINEKFGDGIISAVDCKVEVDKVPDANGDRVKVTIEGKFLGYKPW